MGKTKRRGRHRESRQTMAASPAPTTSHHSNSSPPNPPRRNVPLLIICGTVFLLWLVFLACVAVFG